MLTQPALPDLFCRNPQNRENLGHDLNDRVHHLHRRRQFCIDFEASKEHFDPLKDVDKNVLARPSVLSCLIYVSVKMTLSQQEEYALKGGLRSQRI